MCSPPCFPEKFGTENKAHFRDMLLVTAKMLPEEFFRTTSAKRKDFACEILLTGKPACKMTVIDSDHSYWEMWHDTPQVNRNYAWQNFTNGNQVLFMDPYVVYYPREKRNLCLSPINGIGSKSDPRWE